MAYKLHKNYNDFFYEIGPGKNNGLQTQFDIYYLCLMVGLRYNKIGTEDMLKSDAFSKEFIEAYRESKHKIIALLIQTEIERRKINQNIQTEVEKLISEIIDYENKDSISKKGIEYLNLYAAAGFEKIQCNIDDNNHLEYFFKEYLKLIE